MPPEARRVWPLRALDDAEHERVPAGVDRLVDAHVHLFPDRLFDRLWQWFDKGGWPVRYRLYSDQVIAFLKERGVSRFVALHYAHKPGISRGLNRYLAGICSEHPEVHGVATVFPGEPEATSILAEAGELGLRGVKIHCHVQRVAPDSSTLRPIFDYCSERGWPVVMHAGREPRGAAYSHGADPDDFCDLASVERVLAAYPGMKVCVPHFGADECDAYARLLERYDHLWVDTAMAVAEYLPFSFSMDLIGVRPERVMYGSDFPNLPYAWDRELRRLNAHGLAPGDLEQVFHRSAESFFGLPSSPGGSV